MKRLYISAAVITALSLPAWVPVVALSSPDRPLPVIHAPPTPRVWLGGVNPPSTLPAERRQQRHRYLLRKRYLETKQDLAEARAAAQLKAWLLYESTTTTTTPYVPPVTTTTQPYVYVPPATTTTVAPSYGYSSSSNSTYGYVDPSSLPWPASCIVGVESNGYNVSNGVAYGYYQYIPSTWLAYCGCSDPYATDFSFGYQTEVFNRTPSSNWADGC
jgi:hypothetical protein